MLLKKQPYFIFIILGEEKGVWHSYARVLNAHAPTPISLNLELWHFSISLQLTVLVLTRNQVQVARFAEHPPIQRIAAVLVWFRGELDDTDLQTTWETVEMLVVIHVCLWVCILVSVSIQCAVCTQGAYLTSVAVLMVGASQTLNSVAVSTVLFWNN